MSASDRNDLRDGVLPTLLVSVLWETVGLASVHRPLPSRWTVCAPISIAGCVLLVLSGGGSSTDTRPHAQVAGVVLALIPGLAYAITTTIAARLIGAGHPSRSTLLMRVESHLFIRVISVVDIHTFIVSGEGVRRRPPGPLLLVLDREAAHRSHFGRPVCHLDDVPFIVVERYRAERPAMGVVHPSSIAKAGRSRDPVSTAGAHPAWSDCGRPGPTESEPTRGGDDMTEPGSQVGVTTTLALCLNH
jgi:hypothetical protein